MPTLDNTARATSLIPQLLSESSCRLWRDVVARQIDQFRNGPDVPDFSRSSSSLRLRALRHIDHGLDLFSLARGLWRGELRSAAQALLGANVALLADQCWARRQFAPGRYPEGHSPHEWHQDGALHFDFVEPYPAQALLKMLTCWIALSPCGEDAPGLELLRLPQPAPVSPARLNAQWMARHFDSATLWRPLLQPGDCILFSGDTLHRTHVTASMGSERISIELRFVAADDTSARLRQERLVPLSEA